MNKQEETLKKAFEKITPDVWDAIKRDIETEESMTHTVMTEEQKTEGRETLVLAGGRDDFEKRTVSEKKGRTLSFRKIATAAAMLVLLIGGMVGFNSYSVAKTIDSTISLDVNPSIEINTNAKDRVLSVNALNEDAKTVIDDMDFEGADLDVTINALIGSLLRHGYIDEYKNSILLSVDNQDKNKGEAMRQRLLEEINGILQQDGIEGALLSRVSDDDDVLEELAEKYGISEAKAALIQDIISGKSWYSFEDLAGLTINELNLIAGSPSVELSHVISEGRASDKAYIGAEKAEDAALAAAGVDRTQVSGLKCEIDWNKGTMVYEVEFVSDGTEYEYDIDAATGAVVKEETEAADGPENETDDQDDYDDADDDSDDIDDYDDDYDDVYDDNDADDVYDDDQYETEDPDDNDDYEDDSDDYDETDDEESDDDDDND